VKLIIWNAVAGGWCLSSAVGLAQDQKAGWALIVGLIGAFSVFAAIFQAVAEDR
jgi:hypothetical protein